MIYIIYTYDLSSVRVKVASSERKKSECCFCLKYELISAEFLFIVQTTQKTCEFSSKYLCQGSAEQSTVGSIRNIQNSFHLSPTGTIKRTAVLQCTACCHENKSSNKKHNNTNKNSHRMTYLCSCA